VSGQMARQTELLCYLKQNLLRIIVTYSCGVTLRALLNVGFKHRVLVTLSVHKCVFLNITNPV
jgi:hypothetical protein